MMRLCTEYTERFDKHHFCESQCKVYYNLAERIPDGELERFSIAISKEAKCRSAIKNFDKMHPVSQYRAYYKYDKTFGRWKKNKPDWLTTY